MNDETELRDLIGRIGIPYQPSLIEQIEIEIFQNLNELSNRQYVKNLIEIDDVKKIVSTSIKNIMNKTVTEND